MVDIHGGVCMTHDPAALLPCPWTKPGEDCFVQPWPSGDKWACGCDCEGHSCYTVADTKQEAIAAWNACSARPALAPTPGAVKKNATKYEQHGTGYQEGMSHSKRFTDRTIIGQYSRKTCRFEEPVMLTIKDMADAEKTSFDHILNRELRNALTGQTAAIDTEALRAEIAQILNQARCHETRTVGNHELAGRITDHLASTGRLNTGGDAAPHTEKGDE